MVRQSASTRSEDITVAALWDSDSPLRRAVKVNGRDGERERRKRRCEKKKGVRGVRGDAGGKRREGEGNG